MFFGDVDGLIDSVSIEKIELFISMGQRALDWYNDTGQCFFCAADDELGVPHCDHCEIGILLERIKLK